MSLTGAKKAVVNIADLHGNVSELLPYKLVACDMDGTLLSNDHVISHRTRHVIAELLSRGVHFIFATGRPFTDVYRIKRRFKIGSPSPSVESTVSNSSRSTEHDGGRCFAITSNGACVYDENNERIYERNIDPVVCEELYNMFKGDREININIFRSVDEEERRKKNYKNPSDRGNDKAHEEWVSRYPAPLEAALYKDSHFTFKVVPNLEQNFPTDRVTEIFFLCYNPDKSLRTEETINERMKQLQKEKNLTKTVRVAPSAPHCLDIMPTDVSKGEALHFVLDRLQLEMKDCIAFGDGMNDVEMLSEVGKGCIMQNGSERLREKLPNLEVIGKNDFEGVANKLIEIFRLDID